ncbi:MAG: glycosyltransferase family 2 protein [Candidatus Pacebacteria bacterium]|nr:glycosyltransferase family 2 protein [Candidatus Paceibacterota bacterium]
MDAAALGVYAAIFLALFFEVFLLISFFEKRPAQMTALRPKRYPTTTIIVPCWNEGATIGGTIESLLSLDYPADKLNIMVVDDGSQDNTGSVAREYAQRYPARVEYHYKENGGKWTALNFGISRTQAELVGCLDADSFVDEHALVEIVKLMENDPAIMAVTPAMKVNKPKRLIEMMQAVEYTFGIFFKKMFDNLSAISVLPGPFSFYKREIFDIIGPFKHAHNTEDMEIAFRMHQHGLKIANAHTAYVYTNVPTTVRALVKQRTRWSQGFLQNSQDYSHMYLNRKFGNFGMLVLPVGLAGFAAALYTAGFLLYNLVSLVILKVSGMLATGVPPQLPSPRIDWFYIDTSMMLFLTLTVAVMTLVAVLLGQRIAKTQLGVTHFVSYFLLFGLIAPLWLARAAWGALLAQESAWR